VQHAAQAGLLRERKGERSGAV